MNPKKPEYCKYIAEEYNEYIKKEDLSDYQNDLMDVQDDLWKLHLKLNELATEKGLTTNQREAFKVILDRTRENLPLMNHIIRLDVNRTGAHVKIVKKNEGI